MASEDLPYTSSLIPKNLYTDRLTLVSFERSPEQFAAVLAAVNSPTAHQRMGDAGLRTPEDWNVISRRSRFRTPPFGANGAADSLIYLIHLGHQNPTGEIIGMIGISQRAVGSRILPPDMGWVLMEGHMEKGYATEAAREVLRWATQDFGVKELIVYLSETNKQSNHVAEKLGFVVGGRIADTDSPGKFHTLLMLPGMERIEVNEGMNFKLSEEDKKKYT